MISSIYFVMQIMKITKWKIHFKVILVRLEMIICQHFFLQSLDDKFHCKREEKTDKKP